MGGAGAGRGYNGFYRSEDAFRAKMVRAYRPRRDAKVEADGDIHLALQDADGKNAGTVSAEIPVGPKWCEIRQMVFGWTKQKFPFTVKSVHDLTIAEHVVTVTGKAFYDIAHAPADHSNRRHSPKDYAVWEIHPVMKLEVVQ